MANYGWQDIDIILVDGFNAQAMTVIDLTLPKSVAIIEKLHGAGNEWGTAVDTGTRRPDGEVVLRVPLDNDANKSREAFITNAHAADGTVAVGVTGNSLGDEVQFFQAHHLDYSEEGNADQVTKLVATWSVDGQIHTGSVVVPLAVVGADGNSEATPLDNTASSANGGVACLQGCAVALDGHTGLAVTVRHSPDNITYADLVAFTTLTADGAEIKTVVAGTTVDRYLAAAWDFTGSGTSPSATVFVAFKRS
jgi:hypothetical protein